MHRLALQPIPAAAVLPQHVAEAMKLFAWGPVLQADNTACGPRTAKTGSAANRGWVMAVVAQPMMVVYSGGIRPGWQLCLVPWTAIVHHVCSPCWLSQMLACHITAAGCECSADCLDSMWISLVSTGRLVGCKVQAGWCVLMGCQRVDESSPTRIR